MAHPNAWALLLLVACLALVALAAGTGGSACSLGSERCDVEDVMMLQARNAHVSAQEGFGCSKRSLILGPVVGEDIGFDTYLQWNGRLTASGADFMELLNLTVSDDTLRSQTDVDFVKHGKPLFGIVLVRLFTQFPLAQADAAKLKEYLDVGGLLVVSETTPLQVNALMEELRSSIRQTVNSGEGNFPCSTPEDAPYVPHKHSAWCPLTKGVTGLQGSNLEEVLDDADSSWPLFTLSSNTSFVVARAEKKRSLVVIGDDEPTDDDCVTNDENNLFAFGPSTNLKFFSNLFEQRCRYVR